MFGRLTSDLELWKLIPHKKKIKLSKLLQRNTKFSDNQFFWTDKNLKIIKFYVILKVTVLWLTFQLASGWPIYQLRHL